MGRLAKGQLIETHPQIAQLLLDKNDGIKYTYGTKTKVWFVCPECGHKMFKAINKVISIGLRCEICSDGISIGEKIIHNLLLTYTNEIEKEKIFIWANDKKYDFYISSLNLIVEVFGSQHYKEEFSRYNSTNRKARTYEEEQANDIIKENLATANGILNYIIIDARHSELDYIKESIINSELSKLFDLSIVNWDEIFKRSLKSKAIEACEIWNSGIRSSKKIGDILSLSKSTISKYLKKCAIIGLCDYDSNKEKCIHYMNANESVKRKVVCVTTRQIFDSITDGANYFNISNAHITSCIKGERGYAGRHPITKKCLVWIYYEDYDENNVYIIPKAKATKKVKKIICLNNKQIFNNVNDAIKIVEISSPFAIRNNCTGRTKYAGHLNNGEEAKWMYYKDYLNINPESKQDSLLLCSNQ
jgi:hypothetical protein